MPPDRSNKVKERKVREQTALAKRIILTGFEMFPCSNCSRNHRLCIASSEEDSSRCAECARRGLKCDIEGIPVGDWESLEREEARLQSERDAAFRLAKESLARVERLEKQQAFLKRKGKDMLARGLKTMDELEEAEEKEKQQKENEERASREAAANDPNELPALDPFYLDPALVQDQAFWAELGFPDGTQPASQGS